MERVDEMPARTAVLALLALLIAPAAGCATPSFAIPLRCQLGVTCFVQNYVAHGSDGHWRDYTCGRLSYAHHEGTDFRLQNLDAMDHGVEVLAAAPGIVLGVRDGEPDISIRARGKENLHGRDAGNGVVIEHADGWQTQYSHLHMGSVRVPSGERVVAGQALGLVGLSGNTEFPHLDFAVRHAGSFVDPFDPFAPNTGERCGDGKDSLWQLEARAALAYRPTGVLNSVITGGVPNFNALTAAYRIASFSLFRDDSKDCVYFVEIFGLQRGDELTLTLYG